MNPSPDRLATALRRGGRMSGQEQAVMFVLGGILFLLRGFAPLLLPGVPQWIRANASIAFWLSIFLGRVTILPAIQRRFVLPREGRRPRQQSALPVWPEAPWWRCAAGLMAVACALLSIANDWWVAAAGLAGSVAAWSPWYALAGLGLAIALPRFPGHQTDIVCVGIGVALVFEGLTHWLSYTPPIPAPRGDMTALEMDLLRFFTVAKGADAVWLEQCSGLGSPEEVRAVLSRLVSHGFVRVESDSFALTRQGENEVDAVPRWTWPPSVSRFAGTRWP